MDLSDLTQTTAIPYNAFPGWYGVAVSSVTNDVYVTDDENIVFRYAYGNVADLTSLQLPAAGSLTSLCLSADGSTLHSVNQNDGLVKFPRNLSGLSGHNGS